MSADLRKILKGALIGGLTAGGVGFGIPSAYHASKGELMSSNKNLGGATRFGLISAIPGALIGAVLAASKDGPQLQHPTSYLGSASDRDELLYKDLLEFYNTGKSQVLTENEFHQLYSR